MSISGGCYKHILKAGERKSGKETRTRKRESQWKKEKDLTKECKRSVFLVVVCWFLRQVPWTHWTQAGLKLTVPSSLSVKYAGIKECATLQLVGLWEDMRIHYTILLLICIHFKCFQDKNFNWVCWLMPIISLLGRVRQEDHKFNANVGYLDSLRLAANIVRLYF